MKLVETHCKKRTAIYELLAGIIEYVGSGNVRRSHEILWMETHFLSPLLQRRGE